MPGGYPETSLVSPKRGVYESERGLGTVVIEVPGHVNGSGLSALGLVCGRRRCHRFPSRFFTCVVHVF